MLFHYIIYLSYIIKILLKIAQIIFIKNTSIQVDRMNYKAQQSDHIICVQDLKKAYQMLFDQQQALKHKIQSYEMERQCQMQKINMKMINQDILFQRLANDKNKRIQELQQAAKKFEVEENEKNRKQIRKYIDQINEKETQIINLRKQITSFKTKISNLENEASNLHNIHQNFQIFILKGMKQLKISSKETNNNIDQTDTQKMIMESKLRQTNQKMNLLYDKIQDLQLKHKSLNQNFFKLRDNYKDLKQENINQKFQLQRLRQKHPTSFDSQSTYSFQGESFLFSTFQKLQTFNQLLIKQEELIFQLDKYHKMNLQLIQQNNKLKQLNGCLYVQIQDLKCKYIINFENEIIKQRQGSLYIYLLQKKNQLQKFEQSIERIQSYIDAKDQQIMKIIEKMKNRELGCTCGKKQEFQRLHGEYETLNKKNQYLQDSNLKMRLQKDNLNKLIQNYKFQIKDFQIEVNKKGKKKVIKKRCYQCMFNIQKEKKDNLMKCDDCNYVYHNACIAYHICNQFKLEEGMSMMTGHND